jgi:NAD(P)-dependent dehydrogenase (short-subunit alcohol dehydrogenase family)
MTDMTGKHVIVTGATNGIGEVAARELARMGATVVVVSRSEAKCKRVVDSIRQQTGNSNVSYMAADLSDMEAVRELAIAYKAKFDRLDVLLNNAGAVFSERKVSADGLEMTFALNHVNYFLLTHELLDLIKSTAAANPDWGARVVNVSSEAHRSGMNWQDVQYENGYNAFNAYGQSKYMNILFTRELATRLEGTGVTTNSLHPGFVGTGFGKETNWFFRAALTLISPFAKTPEQGAETSIYLASSDAVKGVTGKYFADSQQKTPQLAADVADEQKRLWALSEEVTGIKQPV